MTPQSSGRPPWGVNLAFLIYVWRLHPNGTLRA